MKTRWFGALLVLVFAGGCMPKAKVAATPPSGETSSESSGGTTSSGGTSNANRMAAALRDTSVTSAPAPEEKPKGPVYAAPFTADQIRHATKEGRMYRYKVETPDQAPTEYTITFRHVDDGGAELSTGGSQPKRMSWKTLQQNSEFPKDKVVTHPDKVKVPAGKFDCIVYEVTAEDGEVWTYYFAKKLPGAPVFFFAERDGERLRTTTLVEHYKGK